MVRTAILHVLGYRIFGEYSMQKLTVKEMEYLVSSFIELIKLIFGGGEGKKNGLTDLREGDMKMLEEMRN